MEYLKFPDDKFRGAVSELVDRALLDRLQEALTQSGRLSLSVCEPDGAIFTQSLLDKADLHHQVMSHRLFAAEILMKASLQEGSLEGPVRVKGGGGASMLVMPLKPDSMYVGAIVAGPVWSRRPTRDQVQAFLHSVGSRRRVTPRLVKSAAVLTSSRSSRVRQELTTVGLLITQICAERLQHMRRISTLATLNRIGQAVNSTLGLEALLQMVLDTALGLLAADCGSLMLKDSSGQELRILVARGLSPEIVASTRVPLGMGIAGWVAREGEPRLLRRGVREAGSHSAGTTQLQSGMCVPLKVRDEVIGVLNVKGRFAGDDFTEEDMAVLAVVASHAAGAIANAQLYEKASRKATEMSALYTIGTAVNSELERNQVLQKVLDHATELLSCRKGSLMLLDPETGELHIEVASGLPSDIISSVRVRLGEGIAGKVAQEGTPRLLRKGVAERDSQSRGRYHAAALCVPLVLRERVIGVINVSDRHDDGDFADEDLSLLSAMANQAATAIENAKLHNELQELFVSSITALANAIDARDPYTRGHSERVALYAVRLGEYMGMEGRELDFLRYAALLHDVGKINIRDDILNKPGKLTEDEFTVMKRHPEYGAAIMMPVRAFRRILPFMVHHHERFHCKGGYPEGLEGDQIPQEARIIAVADSYDAMTSHRPYRRALSTEEALAELAKNSGTQFDPECVRIFLRICEDDPGFARLGIEASEQAESEGWIGHRESGGA